MHQISLPLAWRPHLRGKVAIKDSGRVLLGATPIRCPNSPSLGQMDRGDGQFLSTIWRKELCRWVGKEGGGGGQVRDKRAAVRPVLEEVTDPWEGRLYWSALLAPVHT